MTVTLAAVHEQLRRDTAQLLGYDYSNLHAAQSVRIDRACVLRLELEDCQNKKLAGQPFDMNKYIVASENLERLFGGDPENETPAPVSHDFDGAFERLSQLLSDRRGRLEEREVRESERLKAELAEKDRVIAEKNSVIAALGGSFAPPSSPSPTPPQPSEPQVSPQPPLPPPNAPVPQSYLRAPPEPWRGDGDRRVMKPSDWDNRG